MEPLMNRNRIHPHLEEIEWIGQLADLKEGHYQQSLLLSAVIELLIEKEILTAHELASKAQALQDEDAASAAAYASIPPSGDISLILHPGDPTP
jgi:hypothetical protein